MTVVAASELKKAIESQHGGEAHYVQSVPVREMHGSEVVWEGTVSVFYLKNSPVVAERAYAWSHELPDGKRRFFALLHAGSIDSPVAALRAAIVAEANSDTTAA